MLRATLSWLFQLVLLIVVTVLTPFIMAVAVWFQDRLTGRMPAPLRFLETYDDLGPSQGMYEPAVAAVYARWGWRAKQWYWLGVRNQCYTLFWWLAPAIDQEPLTSIFETGTHGGPGPWHYELRTHDGRIYFERGWTGKWSSTKKWTIGIGWKIFSVDRFFGPRAAVPTVMDRPLFYLQIKPYSTI
jgi:hypothetical protein